MPKGVVTDEFGVELAVEHNQGRLLEVNFPERSKRNGSVRIEVPALQHPQLPSFDTRDRALVEDLEVLAEKLSTARKAAMEKAVAEGKDQPDPVEVWVAFRSHVVRDQKVDDKLPWSEVPSDAEHRHKRLVAIAEDRTDAASEILRQAEFECKAGRLGARSVQEPEPVPNRPGPAEAMPSGGGQADTYGFTAAVGLVTWAFEVYQATGEPFLVKHVKALSERLLGIADDLQQHLTERPVNRNSNSHTRARGVLRTAVDRYPVPVGVTDDAVWEEWESNVRKTGVMLFDIAKAVHQEHLQAQKPCAPQTDQRPPEPAPPAAATAA